MIGACIGAVVGAGVSLAMLGFAGVVGFSDRGILTGLQQIGLGSNVLGMVVLMASPAVATAIGGAVAWCWRKSNEAFGLATVASLAPSFLLPLAFTFLSFLLRESPRPWVAMPDAAGVPVTQLSAGSCKRPSPKA